MALGIHLDINYLLKPLPDLDLFVHESRDSQPHGPQLTDWWQSTG